MPRPSSSAAGETEARETPDRSVGRQREGRIAEVGVTLGTETKGWRRKKAFFPRWERTSKRHLRENAEGKGKGVKVLASAMFKVMCIEQSRQRVPGLEEERVLVSGRVRGDELGCGEVSAEVDLDEVVQCTPEHKACLSPGIRTLATGVKALLPFPRIVSSVCLGRSPAVPQGPPYISWSLWQRRFIATVKMCGCQENTSLGRLAVGGAASDAAGFPIRGECRAGLTAANFPEGKPVWEGRDPRSTTRGTKSGDKPGPHSLGRLLTQALGCY